MLECPPPTPPLPFLPTRWKEEHERTDNGIYANAGGGGGGGGGNKEKQDNQMSLEHK